MDQTQTPQNKFLIPLAIIVAGVLVAAAIYFGGNTSGRQLTTREPVPNTPETEVAPVTDKDHILGDRNAEVVVIEYSDTECPFCKVFHATMHTIVTEYKGQVSWVYRHFPIAQLHAKAEKESEATECAAEQGGNTIFWKYIDQVFALTRSNDSLDPAELPKIASSLGLNVTAFNNCLSSGKYSEFIKESIEEAIKAGALGTPYSVAIHKDGRKVIINGAEPIESVRIKLNELLK